MRHQGKGNTLQTTALVHEAYLHFRAAKDVVWRDRAHFFASPTKVMRRILIDAARARTSLKRGGGMKRVDHSTPVNLDEIPSPASAKFAELLALDVALSRLEQLDDRKARVVELRFFGGLGVEEVADVLNISPQSVMRDWRLARVWLARELRGL
jgi:RNA polymerase sigma factor (TIGR02999 family)